MVVKFNLLENRLRIIYDNTTGTLILQRSDDGGATWIDLHKANIIENKILKTSIFADDITIEKDTPTISLKDTAAGVERRLSLTGGAAKILDGTGAEIVNIESHGARHSDVNVDPLTDLNYDLTISKATPAIQLSGTETGGVSVRTIEDTGKYKLQYWDGTTWVDKLSIDAATGNVELIGNFLVDIAINKTTPAIRLTGTETGAKDLSIRENAGKIEIYDNTAAKVIKSLPQLDFDSGLVGLTIGTGGAFGAATDLVTAEDMENLIPEAIYMEVGGTVATGETVDIEVRAVTDAGDEIVIASYSVTGATGSTTVGKDTITTNLLNNARAAGISLNNKRIVAIRGYAKTSATSTTATASAQVIGKRV